jgi:hypothetical protein
MSGQSRRAARFQQREQQRRSFAAVLVIVSVVFGELPEHPGDAVGGLAGDLGATRL